MTEKQMQNALNKIAKLSRELDKAAKEKWGRNAFVFAESEGGICIMSGDSDPDRSNSSDRQKFIVMEATGHHALGVGAWW